MHFLVFWDFGLLAFGHFPILVLMVNPVIHSNPISNDSTTLFVDTYKHIKADDYQQFIQVKHFLNELLKHLFFFFLSVNYKQFVCNTSSPVACIKPGNRFCNLMEPSHRRFDLIDE